MAKDKGRLGILLSALLTLVCLSFAPATAGALEVPPTGGSSLGDSPHGIASYPSGKPTSVNPGGPMQPAPGDSPKPLPAVTPENTQHEVLSLQQQGNSYVAQLRDKAGNQTQSVAVRQKKCQQLQAMVNLHITDFSQNAQSHLATFNTIFTKVQAFASSKKITSTEYTSLVATASTQQANAQQAVDALKSVAVTINCSAADPASSLSTIKSAVDSTRTALQAYQKAIAAVISNLEANVKQ